VDQVLPGELGMAGVVWGMGAPPRVPHVVNILDDHLEDVEFVGEGLKQNLSFVHEGDQFIILRLRRRTSQDDPFFMRRVYPLPSADLLP